MKIESYHVFRLVFGMMVVLILGALAVGLYAFTTERFGSFWEYSSFEISDWLINYEGGFVRRGIVGQILHLLYQVHPYPVRHVIVGLYILGYMAITGLLVWIFRKEGWSVFILPFTICLYYAFTCDMLWTRRDYWSLLLAFLVYGSYFKFICRRQAVHLAVFYLASAFTILMHEASAFYTFPTLVLLSLFMGLNESGESKTKKCLSSLAAIWLPLLLLFLFVVTHKGDAAVMAAVWHSWEPCFLAYPTGSGELPDIGNGVEFLEKTSLDAVLLHIRLVWLARFAPYVPSLPFNIYMIAATYYLVTRLNTVDLRFFRLKSFDGVTLSNIVIMQFVFLLPMFGFLSCDLGRVVPYWVISSLLLFYIIKSEKVSADSCVPGFLNRTSERVQHWIDGVKVLNNPWVYMLIIVTLPLKCYYGASYEGIVPVQYLLKILKFLGV